MLITNTNIELLTKVILKYDNFAILPHYNPDPDALGSAFAIQFIINKIFKKQADIYYQGIIGRAENKIMIDILNIPLIEITDDEQICNKPNILLDTQPGSGNNPLLKNKKPIMIFDHHPVKLRSKSVEYADVRTEFGSTCTLLYEYIKAFDLKPTVNVATALYYGIQTDIVGEGRNGDKIDYSALESLSKYINRHKLYSIENPKLPFDYYLNINKGLKNSVIYDDFIITSLGQITNPDYVGEIADFLIRFEKANLVLVVGVHNNLIQLSFRSQSKKVDSGLTLKKIVGGLGSAGGHHKNAGGRIQFDDNEDGNKIINKIITRSLELIHGKIMTGIPFLSLGDYFKL